MARAGALLLLLAAAAVADDVRDRIYLVSITTKRATRGGTARTTLAAPALPVGPDGLMLAVGFAVDAPEDDDEAAIEVSVVAPDGRIRPARLLGGDRDLECTFFRLLGDDLPEPVALESAGAAVGDEVVLLGRHGPLLKYAPRRVNAHIDAVVASPQTLYALREPLESRTGCIAATKDGRLLGFVDNRPTLTEGTGLLLGVGSNTLVIVAADVYKAAKWKKPERRAWLGVNLAPFDRNREAFFDVAEDWRGALVTGIADGSPAAAAGVKVHDLLQSIGPLTIQFEKESEWGRMLRAVQHLPLGEPLLCRVVRFSRKEDGGYTHERLEVTMVLSDRPLEFDDAPETEVKDLGLRVKPLTLDRRRADQLPREISGVVVSRIARAGVAQLGGLRPLDLVLRVDDQPVPDVNGFLALLDEARANGRSKVVLFVRRGTETLFVPLRTGW